MTKDNYTKLIEGTEKLLEESRKEANPYIHEVLGKSFVVLPGVFSPKYFKDTEFFAEYVPKHVKGASFLEIGGGTGIVSCFVGMKTPRMVIDCTDINLEAVKNIRLNTILHDLDYKMGAFESDIYDTPYDRIKTYNNIFWNVPFADQDHKGDMLAKAVWDPGYQCLERFIAGAEEHLKPTSRLLIGFSTTLGQYEVMEELLDKHDFEKPRLLAEEISTEGNPNQPVKFELFESHKKE